MKGRDVRLKFIVMRAQEKSLNTCAKELGVSRQTLANWEREYAEDIGHLRAVELDALAEAFWMKAQGRIELIGGPLKRVKEEFDGRDLAEVSTVKLVELMLKLVNELRKEPSSISVMSTEEIGQAVFLKDRYDSPDSWDNPVPERRAGYYALEKLDKDKKSFDNADSN